MSVKIIIDCDGPGCLRRLFFAGGDIFRLYTGCYGWFEDVSEYPLVKNYCPQCWEEKATIFPIPGN